MSTETPSSPNERRVTAALEALERFVVLATAMMMMVVVALSTLDLAWMIVKNAASAPALLLQLDELLEIFSFILLILIGVELLETIKGYLKDHVVHLSTVLEVALIAVARKVIVLDLAKYDGLTLLAVAALVLALAGAFAVERRAQGKPA